jgi:hypothetical protein
MSAQTVARLRIRTCAPAYGHVLDAALHNAKKELVVLDAASPRDEEVIAKKREAIEALRETLDRLRKRREVEDRTTQPEHDTTNDLMPSMSSGGLACVWRKQAHTDVRPPSRQVAVISLGSGNLDNLDTAPSDGDGLPRDPLGRTYSDSGRNTVL